MNASPIGYVVEGDVDKAKLERHVSLTQPISMTVINNHQYALHLKRNVIPATDIYIRNVDDDGDGNDSTDYTFQSYFDKYEPLTENGTVGLQFGNEGDFSPEAAAKLIPFMQEAVKRRLKISLPGVAVGNTPSAASGWAMYHEFVDYACHNQTYIAIDLHEYFLALPTSGMITKDTQPGDVLYFTHALRTFEQWQEKIVTDFTNFYHVGRCGHLFTYAKSKGWPAPIVDLGEFGSDFVQDNPTIEQWARLIQAFEARNIDGFRTLRDYWRNQFPKLTPSEAFFKMLRWLWENILQRMGVRSVRLFEWNDNLRWKNFNVAADPSLLLWLESSLLTPPKTPVPPAPVEPVLPIFPSDFDVRAEEGIASVNFNVRLKPQLTAALVSAGLKGDKTRFIPAGKLKAAEKIFSTTGTLTALWMPVKIDTFIGWVWAGSVAFDPLPAPPDHALKEAYEVGLASVQSIGETIGRLGVQLAAARDDLSKTLELLRAIEPLIK